MEKKSDNLGGGGDFLTHTVHAEVTQYLAWISEAQANSSHSHANPGRRLVWDR